MQMEDNKVMDLVETTERLEAVAAALEAAAERIAAQQIAMAAEAQEVVGRITATVESAREAELERRLAEAEARVAQLMAAAESQSAGRKTLPVGMATMLAKSGVHVDSIEAGAIDGALASLSIEQRIAVKAELMRAGLL
jgi:cell division septum initiation protein DivIVA